MEAVSLKKLKYEKRKVDFELCSYKLKVQKIYTFMKSFDSIRFLRLNIFYFPLF